MPFPSNPNTFVKKDVFGYSYPLTFYFEEAYDEKLIARIMRIFVFIRFGYFSQYTAGNSCSNYI